jgi:pantoate kinase
LHQNYISVPKRAVTEHVRGCAGIRLHIAPDGTPHDITVVAEVPAGYGFGDAAKQAAASMIWAPVNDSKWQYIVFNQGARPH